MAAKSLFWRRKAESDLGQDCDTSFGLDLSGIDTTSDWFYICILRVDIVFVLCKLLFGVFCPGCTYIVCDSVFFGSWTAAVFK